MREIELKAVVTDWDACRRRLDDGGARHMFSGTLHDRRYDTAGRDLARKDEVLRLRVQRDAAGETAELDWKGPTRRDAGYKEREELATGVRDAAALREILTRLGYVVTYAVDREIVQYEMDGAVVRLERYPLMDDLVEVEGAADAIERAVARLGIPREAFTTERLPAFVLRFQQRTGRTAALSDEERAGVRRFDLEDA